MTLLPLNLPDGFTPRVSVNDKITVGQIVAEKKTKLSEKIIPVSKALGVAPKSILKYLNKKPGDRVKEGDVLITKKGIFGDKKLLSPFSGTVLKLEEDTGDLFIATDSVSQETILSPVDGKVNFCDNLKIVIETNKPAVAGLKATGEKGEGELEFLSGDKIGAEDVKPDVADKIILGKTFDKTAFFKAFALGAKGIICENLNENDFDDFQEKKVKAFFQVSQDDFKKLKEKSGKKVYLDPEKKLILFL